MRDSVDPHAIPSQAMDICRSLSDRGHGAWVVGGCVRDHLLGREVADWDICTTARPEALLRIFPKAVPTGIAHGTITVVRGHDHYEVTTLRGEGAYSDGRRPDSVHFLDDVTLDLARRDFTVNAIAWDPLRAELVDPFRGREDLANRVLRAVGDPAQRFAEDGLRILRGARFAATLEFDLDPATEAAMEGAIEVFRKVSAERVRDEWMKAMKARRPSRAFAVMHRRGVLGVVLPEAVAASGCEFGPPLRGDVWSHTLRSIDATPADGLLRVAALLRLLGMSSTRSTDPSTGATTYPDQHARGAELAERWSQTYRFSNDERTRLTRLVLHQGFALALPPLDSSLRRGLRAVGVDIVPDLFTLARSDAAAMDGELGSERNSALDAAWARIESVLAEHPPLDAKSLAVDGTTLIRELGMKPSKSLGQMLSALLEEVLDDPSRNTREALLESARSRLAKASSEG